MNTTARRLAVQPHAIAAALAIVLASGAVSAQSLRDAVDGTSNTVAFGERARASATNTLTADRIESRAVLNGTLTQTSNGPATGGQVAAIGSGRDLRGNVGSLTTDATVSADLSQFAGATGIGAPARQTLSIGSTAGNLSASEVTTRAAVAAPVTQFVSGVREGASQSVEIGSAANLTGDRFLATGTVAGGSLVQNNSSEIRQLISVGALNGVTAGTAEANGTVSSNVIQVTPDSVVVSAFGDRAGEGQVLRVGSIVGSQVQNASARGTLTAALTQSASQTIGQSVDIGSIVRTDAAGSISTDAVVAGARVTQAGGGFGGEQRLRVGSVVGGTPQSATTRATLTGGVQQANAASAQGDLQRISIGSIEGAGGRATTDATVSAALQQTMTGAGGLRTQEIVVAGVEGGSATVSARATVAGSITQTMGSSAGQAVRIGSVSGLAGGTASTSVDVNGAIVQSAGNGAGGQTILIGSIGSSSIAAPNR